MKNTILTVLVALTMVLMLSGCFSRVETGSVGIIKHWGGEISQEPQHGFVSTALDSMVAEVDTTETRVAIDNLQPADANNVLVDKLDLVASFRLNDKKVPQFYNTTKELDTYRDDSGRIITTVGLKVIENFIKHAVQEQTKKQSLVALSGNLTEYEKAIMAQAQAEINVAYPDLFTIIRVNVNHFVPPESIRVQANKTAAFKSEAERNTEEQKLIAQRAALERSKALVEAQALRAAIDETHLTAEQLISWKNARAYESQAKAFGENAQAVITPQPGGK